MNTILYIRIFCICNLDDIVIIVIMLQIINIQIWKLDWNLLFWIDHHYRACNHLFPKYFWLKFSQLIITDLVFQMFQIRIFGFYILERGKMIIVIYIVFYIRIFYLIKSLSMKFSIPVLVGLFGNFSHFQKVGLEML